MSEKDMMPMSTMEAIGGENPLPSDKIPFSDPTITKVDSTPKEIGMGKAPDSKSVGQTTRYKQGDISFLKPRGK